MPAAFTRRAAVIAVLVLSVAAVLAWSRRPPRSEEAARSHIAGRRPAPSDVNVVVVTLDTLRADRLGCYGFTGVQTPHIDGLARDGVLFEHATATVPLTFPSHSSMFTGLVPPRHGVRDNGGFFLADGNVTLAERLQDAGWTTGAFVAAWVLDSKWGLAQGFGHYSDRFDLSKYKTLSLGTVQKPGDQVMSDALRWMGSVKDRKFFSWIHLYDPHTPYDPPEPHRSRYPGEPYLGEIAYTDQVVGRLLTWLDENALAQRTVVIVTADHGEGLGDHGESTHGFFVYDSSMRIPLIIRTPWGDRGRVRAQASGVDLMPTVLDLVGLPPQPGLDGGSLARAVLDPSADLARIAYAETYYPRYHFGWQQLRAVRNDRYKYIDAPSPELYDLASDPGETQNIYKGYSARAEGLRLVLERIGGSGAQAAPEREQLDPETLQRLAALGYVGNAAEIDPSVVLPDPKSKIHLIALMNRAKASAQQERFEEAIARMREVITEDARIVDAHLTLGNWLARLGRRDEAIDAFKQVLALKPDNELAMVNLAHIYRARGDAATAIEGYRSALKLDPKSAQTWFHLATLFLDTGRMAEAEKTFHAALQHNQKMGAAYNSLGAIAYARRDIAAAERLIRQALELEPDVRTGRFNLARIMEDKGDVASAEALYHDEIATYPDNGKARFNLAQIYRARGDRPRYLAELEAAVNDAPDFGPPYFFLAREHLSVGRLDSAAEIASRGLKMAGASEVAPLGHYVLADVYNRQGRAAEARSEVARAQKLEAAIRRQPQKLI